MVICDEDRKISREEREFTLPRKATIIPYSPVPKPTQVGEKRILRRAEEPFVKELGKMTP